MKIALGIFAGFLFLLGAISLFQLGVSAGQQFADKDDLPRLIYLETQVYDVAGLDEDQYVMRWFDTETMRVIQVDVRGKENAERIRKEIER